MSFSQDFLHESYHSSFYGPFNSDLNNIVKDEIDLLHSRAL